MSDYSVTLVRTGIGFKTIRIRDVASACEATRLALERAGNFEYVEKAADYEVDDVMEIPPEDHSNQFTFAFMKCPAE